MIINETLLALDGTIYFQVRKCIHKFTPTIPQPTANEYSHEALSQRSRVQQHHPKLDAPSAIIFAPNPTGWLIIRVPRTDLVFPQGREGGLSPEGRLPVPSFTRPGTLPTYLLVIWTVFSMEGFLEWVLSNKQQTRFWSFQERMTSGFRDLSKNGAKPEAISQTEHN